MASSTPQAPPPQPGPSGKKTSPLVWVLVGCGGIVLLAAVIMLVAGVFVAKKVGSYAKEAEKNPAMAAAKLVVAMNPELEMVSTDEDAGTITIRNKKTGEQVTVDFEDVKKGKIRFRTDDGKTAEISASGEGESGRLEISSDEGSMRFGAGGEGETPEWVPEYPGSSPEGMFSRSGPDGVSAAFTFTTSDSPEDVMAFYERELKQAGFEVTSSTFKKGATLAGGMINAVKDGQRRTVHVTISAEDGGTQVAFNYSENNEI